MKITDIETRASTLLRDLLQRTDTNHDGDISKQEFKTILAQALKPLPSLR